MNGRLDVWRIYEGSDGEQTRALYAELSSLGPIGAVAVNLFRAEKCSTRAKVYRGGIPGKGSYRRMAYDRKTWSLSNLCAVLGSHALELGIRWGWRRDRKSVNFEWVLYVDVPGHGQASFHSPERFAGPDYPGEYDGSRQSHAMIVAFCDYLLKKNPDRSTPAAAAAAPSGAATWGDPSSSTKRKEGLS